MSIEKDVVDAPSESLFMRLKSVEEQHDVAWYRPFATYDRVYCILRDEMIAFESFGESDQPVDDVDKIKLVIASCRGARFVWTKNVSSVWMELLQLISSSEVAPRELGAAIEDCRAHITKAFGT